MPKVKTDSRAKKTFKVTGTGKVARRKAFKAHILTKKSKKRKRRLGKQALVHKADMSNVKYMLRMK